MVEKGVWHEVSEKVRTYQFRDGLKLSIEKVTGFMVSKSGTHYIRSTTGTQYIIASGWLYLSFIASDFTIPTGGK